MSSTIVDCSQEMRLWRDTRIAGFLGPTVATDGEVPACTAAVTRSNCEAILVATGSVEGF